MIAWKPYPLVARDGTRQDAEIGSFLVPAHRANPVSVELELRVVRIPARHPSGAQPVVFLSGGPGDSGIQWADHGPFLRVFQRVSEQVDVLLLDQRFTGLSESDYSVAWPEAIPANAVRDAWSAYRFLEAHLQKQMEPRRNHYMQGAVTAIESAEDLETLRRALGVPKLGLWGYSYGTHLAQMAMRGLPDAFDRVVLCGFEGPDQTFKLPRQLQAQLERLHGLARAQGYDLLGSMARVLSRLEDAPQTVQVSLRRGEEPVPIQVGAFALRHLTAMWCSLSNRFARLPRLYAALDRGETGPLIECLPLYCRHLTRPLTFYLTDAASGATPGRWERILAEAPETLLENAANFPFPEIGRALDAGEIGDGLRAPVRSELPILILTGSLDGFAPTTNFLEHANLLPGAVHREVAFAAHNDLIGSPDAVEGIAQFFGSGELPVAGDWSVEAPEFE